MCIRDRDNRLDISVLPTPVGPIIKIFFGKTSSFISPLSACLLHLFLRAIATALFAFFCPTTNLSNSETISLGEREFKIVDVANTQTQSNLITTRGRTTYVSTPLDVVQRGTSINVTTPVVTGTSVSRTRTNTIIKKYPIINAGIDIPLRLIILIK